MINAPKSEFYSLKNNGDHLCPQDDFCYWFREFLKKLEIHSLAGGSFLLDEVREVKCIGAGCRGKKKFKTKWSHQRICPSCKALIQSKKPLRDQDHLTLFKA